MERRAIRTTGRNDSAESFLPVVLIALLSMFLLGLLIDWICRLFHVPKETRTSLVLLGTLKNQGLSSGLALTLFTQAWVNSVRARPLDSP